MKIVLSFLLPTLITNPLTFVTLLEGPEERRTKKMMSSLLEKALKWLRSRIANKNGGLVSKDEITKHL